MRKIKSHENFSSLTTAGGGTKPLADLEKRKKGKLVNLSLRVLGLENFGVIADEFGNQLCIYKGIGVHLVSEIRAASF